MYYEAGHMDESSRSDLAVLRRPSWTTSSTSRFSVFGNIFSTINSDAYFLHSSYRLQWTNRWCMSSNARVTTMYTSIIIQPAYTRHQRSAVANNLACTAAECADSLQNPDRDTYSGGEVESWTFEPCLQFDTYPPTSTNDSNMERAIKSPLLLYKPNRVGKKS